MIQLSVRIDNLEQLRANARRAPSITLKYLSAATKAALFEVEKQAVDANFQFKTPRALRTGYLALSFAYGRNIEPSGLRASIGPTARYAPYVYFGTSRGIRPNPYMDRIAGAAEEGVNKQFEVAVDRILEEVADV
jgi:hypothetical protein